MSIIDEVEIHQDWTEDGYEFKDLKKEPILKPGWVEAFLGSEYYGVQPYATPEEADAFIHGVKTDSGDKPLDIKIGDDEESLITKNPAADILTIRGSCDMDGDYELMAVDGVPLVYGDRVQFKDIAAMCGLEPDDVTLEQWDEPIIKGYVIG